LKIPADWYGGWTSTMTASPMKGLRNDFSWKFTPAIVGWEHGDFTYDLVEVSHAQASKIIEYFRGSGTVQPARGLWLGDGCAG
jgi:hypothetical protein